MSFGLVNRVSTLNLKNIIIVPFKRRLNVKMCQQCLCGDLSKGIVRTWDL